MNSHHLEDVAFLEMLFEHYHQRLLSYCSWYIRKCPGLLLNADDFVQDAFLDAIEHKDELLTSDNVAGWLFVKCKKRCDSAIRRYGRRKKILKNPVSLDEVHDLPDSSDSVIQWFYATEAEEMIQMLCERLSELEKKVFTAYFVEQLSLKQSALRCDTTVDSVRGSIQRIRKKVIDIQRNF